MDDPLRRAILDLLGKRPTAAKRRGLAAVLRQLADEQERLAEAEERSGTRVRGAQALAAHNAARQGRGGRPKGTGARFVRFVWAKENERRGHFLHIGRALWQELEEPKYADPQRLGKRLYLRPCRPGEGYTIVKPERGMPRIALGTPAAEALGLTEGRFAAWIEAGAIVAELP